MNPERQQAIEYLRAPVNGLWRWAENGSVLVWHDGTTIAFREEIVQILECLAPHGLPSFGAIAFLLAACRGKVPAVDDILVDAPVTVETGPKAVFLQKTRDQRRAQMEDALCQLRNVSRLVAELKAGPRCKCVLAEAIFETAMVERHVTAAIVLKGMQLPLSETDLQDPLLPSAVGSCVRHIHIVAEGLKRHTAASLALRLRTGLDALPAAVDADLPAAGRARKLIEDYSRDQEVGMVARAARELMAAVRLPRRLGERDQLAIGGVADITNRGPLDRLLLSELAHDDLTVSVRVALNEALYLRREPPMREPPGTLALLLDSGVRLWGMPRVLATSVALALIACDRQHSDVRVWRAHGKKLLTVDLLTRDGLIEHLSALEIEAHPGDALPLFGKTIAAGARNQSVLITHRDALDDVDFRRALSDAAGAPDFVATVDRAGQFELHTVPFAHRSPRCQAELNLEAIFNDRAGVSPRRTDADPGLPAIFGLQTFPFLLPVIGPVEFWVEGEDGFTHAIVKGRRLVRFRDAHAGARSLAADLPDGKTLWMENVNGTVHLVKSGTNQRAARLVSIHPQNGAARVNDLQVLGAILAVHRCGDVILIIRRHDVRAHALSDGRMLGRELNPHQWLSSRYFRGRNHLYFATWNGTDVRFEPITVPKPFDESVIAFVFDRQGFEGPWFIQNGGVVISSAGGAQHQLPMPPNRRYGLGPIRVSRDGHRIFCVGATPGGGWAWIKNLKTGSTEESPPGNVEDCQLDFPPLLPAWSILRAVESMAIAGDGLRLRDLRSRWRKIALDSFGKMQISDLTARDGEQGQMFVFPLRGRPNPDGCALRKVQWPNGTMVFLDSRGLLHLKAQDPALPEVSLVLSDGEVAGWTSDGYVCGPQFFFEGPHVSGPQRVFERLQRILSS